MRSLITSELKILQGMFIPLYYIESLWSFDPLPRVDPNSLYKDNLNSVCAITLIHLYGLLSGLQSYFLDRLLTFQK